MKLKRSEKTIFILVFAAHFIFAVICKIKFGDHVFISHADSYYFYLQGAKNLLQSGTLSVASHAPFYPDAYHTPAYQLLLAGLLYLKLPFLLIIGIQNLLIAASAIIVHRIGLYVFNSDVIGLFAAIAAGFEPMSFYWGNLFMSDTMFSFLFLYAIYYFIKRNYLAFGILMGGAALTRPIALYFFLILIPLMLMRDFIENDATKDWIKNVLYKIAITGIIFTAVIAPWLIRNKIQFNKAALSSAGWYEFYVAAGRPFAEAENIAYPPAPQITDNFDFTRFDFRYEKYYQDSFLSTVTANPIKYATFHLRRSWESFWNHGYEYLANYVIADKISTLKSGFPAKILNSLILIGNSLWILLYALAAYSLRDKKYRIMFGFILPLLLFNILVSGVMNPQAGDMSRYMLPFTPLIFLFSGMGLKMLISHYKTIL